MKRTSAFTALVLTAILAAGCSSSASTSAAGQPSAAGSPSALTPYQSAQAQENAKTCTVFGEFLEGWTSDDGPTDAEVVDAAQGTNGVTNAVTPASQALQNLVNQWDNQLGNFYANQGNNDTTGPAVEKTDHLVGVYGNQIIA
jgi:hypothetical protein